MKTKKDKIEFIHEAVDTLLQKEHSLETMPSVTFNLDAASDENIVEKIEKLIPKTEEEEPSADTGITKPVTLFPLVERKTMSLQPLTPTGSASTSRVSTSSFQKEIPFLILETHEHVEELLLNPVFSQHATERIEEFNVEYPMPNTFLYKTKMFGASDVSKKMFTSNTSKPSFSLLRQEHEELTLETLQPPSPLPLRSTEETKTVLEKTKYFGYKKMGSRTIVFDEKTKEYKYVVKEPVLTAEEKKVKDELIKLFKLLADVPTFELDEQEKQKLLEETLNQIIKDNDVKIPESSLNKVFYPPVKGFVSHNKIDVFMSRVDTVNVYCDETFEEMLRQTFIENDVTFSGSSKEKIFYYLIRDFVGYGRIDVLMKDEEIEDISCDGSTVPIFIYHRKYQSIETNINFDNPEELDSFVVRLAQLCGKQISIYAPIVDGKLPDGSRLQATLSKTVTDESTFTIRRFREDPLTPIDLIENNTMSVEMAAYFWLAIEHGASILFCGGTASGKTSALNALSLFIPFSHKIVSIEDTREVNLPHKNWIAGTTREGFSTAENEKTSKDIDMFDLIRAGLRQRPRVIIVGEVRGRETYSLFQAMATGHTSYATVHASSIHALIQRLENPPISLPRALLTSLDIIVFINAIPMGKKMVRRITSVTEIIKMDPDTKQLIFMQPFTWVSKVEDRFESTGTSKILTNIRLTNEWDEQRLKKEIENRIKILNWMRENKIRSYTDVGKIMWAYYKDSEGVLKNPGAVLKEEKPQMVEKPEPVKGDEEEKTGFFKLFSKRKKLVSSKPKTKLLSTTGRRSLWGKWKKDEATLKETLQKKTSSVEVKSETKKSEKKPSKKEEKEKLKLEQEQKRKERKKLREQRKKERQRKREQRVKEREMRRKQRLTTPLNAHEFMEKKTPSTSFSHDADKDIDRVLNQRKKKEEG